VYQACEKRVEEEEEGDQKHCTGQYFDYWGCVDKCVSSFFLSNILLFSMCGFGGEIQKKVVTISADQVFQNLFTLKTTTSFLKVDMFS
jgi:hypothetical protein